MNHLLEKHFMVQQGMYFSRKLDLKHFNIFLSDVIEDSYWNYAIINEKEDLSKILKNIEAEFESNNRNTCIYLTNDREELSTEINILNNNGYQEMSTESFMVFNGMKLESKLVVELAHSKQSFTDFKDVFIEAYGGEKTSEQPYGALPDTYITALEQSFNNPEKFFHFVCYDNAIPVSIASLCFFERSGGIYNVGTDPKYRKKGFGLAATVACIDMWRNLKGTQLFLQTETGSAVETWYKKLGYEVQFNGTSYAKI